MYSLLATRRLRDRQLGSHLQLLGQLVEWLS